MARKLNKKQKNLLDQHNVLDVSELPDGVFTELEAMNDYECLRDDANRYLSDNQASDILSRQVW